MIRSLAIVALLSACTAGAPTVFTEPEILAGEEVDAETLNNGRQGYVAYCAACHGEAGDGRGPASVGLQTPPRDFRLAMFKFAGTEQGKLPHDEDLLRIVNGGLEGTAMLQWRIPEPLLLDVLQYVKTFSPPDKGFRHPRKKRGEILAVDDDPWGEARREQAIERGKVVYHGLANCYSCHAAYATRAEINAARAEFDQPPLTEIRDRWWIPTPRRSDDYSVPIDGDPPCETSADCEGGEETVCRFGRCERKLYLMPPDFTINNIRTGTALESLYRVIATGIPGTAMPAWKGALPHEDVWAMAYFVQDVAGWSMERADAVKQRMMGDR